MLGGKLLPFLTRYSATAPAYCSPRKTSSASFSRWALCRHTGSATDMRTDMTARLTSSAAMA